MKKENIQYIILSILYIPILGFMYYLNFFVGILEFILAIIMYLSIFYLFHVIWKTIRKKEYLGLFEYARKFYISIGNLLIVSAILIGSFGYYQLIHKPLELNQITISNGEKTVVFQKMIHIGKQEYYDKIAEEIKKYKQEGYVYYFEGVRPGNEENINKFNEALGIKFEDNLYENLSKLYGVVPQNNFQFLNIENDNDKNIDLSIDEIVSKYEDLKTKENVENIYAPPLDINSEIINSLASLNERQLGVLQVVNLSLMSFLTKNESVINTIQNNFGNQLLFSIILESRDQVVAKEILESEDKNIFATYGALHFDGIFQILQTNDPNWKIVSEQKFYPFQGD